MGFGRPPAVTRLPRWMRAARVASRRFIAGLNAVASAPICEQQIGQMGT